MRRSSESAIALVMTLIMLSVITVMAVAFLALTQRERMNVAQSTQQSDSEIMAEIAAQRGQAEIYARFIAANTNLNAVDLLVSRNYIRREGFIPGNSNPTNVNYDYTESGGPLNNNPNNSQMLQNLANLYYDPRPPVFVNTNLPGSPEILDFRFYLDLNRNRRFETNGLYPIIDENGRALQDIMDLVGDPEWNGVLEHPEFVHSRTNRFVGRYAYIILPIGKSLDVNFIHNQGKQLTPLDPIQDNGYFRYQGVGSWEINLAAFLADLNTNVWNNPPGDRYLYRTNLPGQAPPLLSEGVAFRDATEIYRTRLASYQNLAPANQLLLGAIDFESDMIDQYADGQNINTGLDNDLSSLPWPGAYNWTNFFTHQDFFDVSFPPYDFPRRLQNIGNAISSYDRYTYYRMLAQLSSDSAPELPRANIPQLQQKIGASRVEDFVAEPAGKINLNYNNLDNAITDMMPWDTNRFFNAVADVLLRAQFPFGVSNIYITPTNYYGVTVHRLLQMTANIYDSINQSTNPFPSIFRPFVTNDSSGRLLISGYYYDDSLANVNAWVTNSYGMPMIVGAKKCLPNFNEYVAETVIMATRKLQMHRPNTNSFPNQTNEMFIIGISNFFGLEAWNSCTNAYANRLDLTVGNNVTVTITNSEGLKMVTQDVFSVSQPITSWPGFVKPDQIHNANAPSFIVPLRTNTIALNSGIYRSGASPYLENVGDTNYYMPNSGFRIPDWHLTISNNLIFMLSSGNRLVDFVHLPNLTNSFSLITNFFNNRRAIPAEGQQVAQCWYTNRPGGPTAFFTPTRGVQKQIDISLTKGLVNAQEWKDFANVYNDVNAAIDSFDSFVFKNRSGDNPNLIQQVPFTPARKMVISAKWEVNDPFVHYLDEHLKDKTNHYFEKFVTPFSNPMPTNQSLGMLNTRYKPWGGRPGSQGVQETDMRVRDPGVRKSDDWDFPTNRYPSIGWLGRVHRGTPWQSIYLKSEVVSLADWRDYSLDPWSHPTNDWRLLDVFSVAIHPNASHGQLSVNQTNFAAWSALLSGVVVLSNSTTMAQARAGIETFDPIVIEPGSPDLIRIYEAIQRERDKQPDKVFRRLGEVLKVPELTDLSPFIGRQFPYPVNGLTDAAIERIPQQILSLIKVGDPRYVIYAYGQSLRPADNSILTSGPFMGMCTNYQVTGEFVTRTVFQIEGTAGKPQPVVKSFNILSAE